MPCAVLRNVRAKVQVMSTDSLVMNGSMRYALKHRFHTFSSMFTAYLVALSKALEFASDLLPGHFHNTHRFRTHTGNLFATLVLSF
jgi:hypothetical protein